jgi:hypothetical protein
MLSVQVAPGTTSADPTVFVGMDADPAMQWFFSISPELARDLAARLVEAATMAERLRAHPVPEMPVYAQ